MPISGSYVDLNPSGAPAGAEGRVYYDSTNKKLYYHDGTGWKELVSGAKLSLYAADESEVSTTSTAYTSIKQFNLVKNSTLGLNWNTLKVIVEAYIDTAGQTATIGIYVGGNLMQEITFTETSYTIKTAEIDISGLTDGRYLVDFQMKVTSGTGYFRHLEAWVAM